MIDRSGLQTIPTSDGSRGRTVRDKPVRVLAWLAALELVVAAGCAPGVSLPVSPSARSVKQQVVHVVTTVGPPGVLVQTSSTIDPGNSDATIQVTLGHARADRSRTESP
jgi:hypothetical protein